MTQVDHDLPDLIVIQNSLGRWHAGKESSPALLLAVAAGKAE
jgi:hypothetical protein